jgi:hypothetical protein
LDARETKLFWENLAVNYMDDDCADELDKVLFRCEELLSDAELSPERTGWKATAALCEYHYKTTLRKPLNSSMGRFRKSGNGDGGPVDFNDSVTKYSSKFIDFCDGDAALSYMYEVFSRLSLLEFACSDMPENAVHDSTSASSTTSTLSQRGGSPKEDPTVAALKEVFGAGKDDKDVIRKRKADAEVAESKAFGVKLDLIVKQEALLDKAAQDILDLEGNDDAGSISKRMRLVKFRDSLEKSLEKLLSQPEASASVV